MFLSIGAKAIQGLAWGANSNAGYASFFNLLEDRVTLMPRQLVFLILFVAILIGGAIALASMDTEQPLQPVEKPVIGDDLQ